MRRLHQDARFGLVDDLIVTFARCGYALDENTKILDFGCGQGRLVYSFRDIGLNAFGCDIHERVDYRSEDDRAFFEFSISESEENDNALLDADHYKIPYPDDTFDVVISTSVLEHVMDLETVMTEISRVMKPNAFTFHLYPSIWVIIEPHMYVPFGSRLHGWWYLYFWALLGVRNEFQEGMSARVVADGNHRYARTGLKYHSRGTIRRTCLENFNSVRFVRDKWRHRLNWKLVIPHRLLSIWRALCSEHPMRALALAVALDAVIAEGKKKQKSS